MIEIIEPSTSYTRGSRARGLTCRTVLWTDMAVYQRFNTASFLYLNSLRWANGVARATSTEANACATRRVGHHVWHWSQPMAVSRLLFKKQRAFSGKQKVSKRFCGGLTNGIKLLTAAKVAAAAGMQQLRQNSSNNSNHNSGAIRH